MSVSYTAADGAFDGLDDVAEVSNGRHCEQVLVARIRRDGSEQLTVDECPDTDGDDVNVELSGRTPCLGQRRRPIARHGLRHEQNDEPQHSGTTTAAQRREYLPTNHRQCGRNVGRVAAVPDLVDGCHHVSGARVVV